MNKASWIFVSHASIDLANVRLVRNYLEENGGAPLLFHLLALESPEEFWPIIEREIAARNFFIYCESAAAEASEWVKREREIVTRTGGGKKRIGRIRVDKTEIDYKSLDRFLAATRIFPSYSPTDRIEVMRYLQTLQVAGFQIVDEDPLLPLAKPFVGSIVAKIEHTALRGWFVLFLSRDTLQNDWVQNEISIGQQNGMTFVLILLESIDKALLSPNIAALHWLDGTIDPASAPHRLASLLLRLDQEAGGV